MLLTRGRYVGNEQTAAAVNENTLLLAVTGTRLVNSARASRCRLLVDVDLTCGAQLYSCCHIKIQLVIVSVSSGVHGATGWHAATLPQHRRGRLSKIVIMATDTTLTRIFYGPNRN